jgi:hypothetical protein
MFESKTERESLVLKSISTNDVLKFMLYALFEIKAIEEKHFLELSIKIEEVGKMLYGWKNNLAKQNRFGN